MKAVAYLRVSTADQALGVDAQREQIARWAEREGAELVGEHVESVSGGAAIDKRPALLAAVALARAGTALVVAKRDRLARDVIVSATVERLVERQGGRIVSADGSSALAGPEGQLFRLILDAFSQYERALIRARTRAALAVKRRRGERVSGLAPVGFRAEGKRLVADDAERRAVARVLELRGRGRSIRDIAATLNEEGFRARGRKWHATTVARLIGRESCSPGNAAKVTAA